jgi:hypothetical protein
VKKYTIFLVIGLWACGKQPTATIDTPIPQDKIVRVFADIHLAESVINVAETSKRDSMAQALYSEVYATNGISPDDFNKTLTLYLDNPTAMKALYEKVVEQLSKDEAETRAQ